MAQTPYDLRKRSPSQATDNDTGLLPEEAEHPEEPIIEDNSEPKGKIQTKQNENKTEQEFAGN